MDNILNSGDKSAIFDIKDIANENRFYRKEIWTGEHLQMTVMSIPPGGEIGLEQHTENDQMLGITFGVGTVYLGDTKQSVTYAGQVNSDYVIVIPAGAWHNVINEQKVPLKIYSVYAPPHHPKGTIHKTKLESDLSGY